MKTTPFSISKYGILKIERVRSDKHKMLAQQCPYSDKNMCNDLCPHFREPVMRGGEGSDGYVTVTICNGTEITARRDQFSDERTSGTGVSDE